MTAATSFSRRLRLIVLAAVAIPAFWRPLLELWPQPIVDGAQAGAVAYGLLVHLVVCVACGRRLYAAAVTVAGLVTVPVVFGGAAVAAAARALGLDATAPQAAGAHYLSLGLTMVTVVVLALALVSQVPLADLERRLLAAPQRLTWRKKQLLMALRVVSHTLFFVLPNLLEVMREEGWGAADGPKGAMGRWIRQLPYLAAEGICAALHPLPLWANEIAALGAAPLPSSHTKQSEEKG